MVLVITNLGEDYGDGYISVNTIKDAIDKLVLVDTIVYNRALDENAVSASELHKLFCGDQKLYYVRNTATMDYSIRLFVEGQGGKVFTEETYLASRSTLEVMLNDSESLYALTKVDNTRTIDEFSKMLNDGSDITRAYGDLVVSCTDKIVGRNQMLEESQKGIAQASVNLISNLVTRIDKVSDEQESLKNQVLNNNRVIQETLDGAEVADGVYMYETEGAGKPYSSVQMRKRNVNIMLIKDVDRCLYLTSFIGGLHRYIESTLKLKCRVIVIENSGVLAQTKYKEYPWITAENMMNMESLITEPIIFTDMTAKRVFEKLLAETDFRVTIIVDRTNYSLKHILVTAYPNAVFYAVQSESSKKLVNVKDDKCITSNEHVEAQYRITYEDKYKTYAKSVDKLQSYMHRYEKVYDKMIHNCESMRDFATDI